VITVNQSTIHTFILINLLFQIVYIYTILFLFTTYLYYFTYLFIFNTVCSFVPIKFGILKYYICFISISTFYQSHIVLTF
jgi:hypothetical protein